MSSLSSNGSLILVATPIGNLGDFSERAQQVLRDADVIACEDTRHSLKLLNHFNIKGVPLISLHEHNETTRSAEIVQRISDGQDVALISDAGMPAISDPGQKLVSEVISHGLAVSVVPGASAAISALCVSGLPTLHFFFEGFLPTKSSDRKARISMLSKLTDTFILYEAPHRIKTTLSALSEQVESDRSVCFVRELTKLHEEIRHTTLGELSAQLQSENVRGECVLVVAGRSATGQSQQVSDQDLLDALGGAKARGLSTKDAVAEVAAVYGVSRKVVYALATR